MMTTKKVVKIIQVEVDMSMLKPVQINTTRGALLSGVALIITGTLFWGFLAHRANDNMLEVHKTESRIKAIEQRHWYQEGETDLALEQVSFAATVVKVHDGDTLTVKPDDKKRSLTIIRLEAIDAPELKQPYGPEAAAQATKWALNAHVTVEPTGQDRYTRTIGMIRLADGTLLNDRLVKAGLAWVYVKYPHPKSLEAVQTEAKKEKRGLWKDDNPIPPWEWRANHKPRPKYSKEL